ncbi:MAG: hypothetical protein ACTSPB_25650, partial [Candidatus Thorarchaeota archaeon]
MMQELHLVLDYIMVVALLTLYGTVTWSLIRYSTSERHRYWAIGWVIYSVGAFMGALLSTSTLNIIDIFALSGMYVGATLIVDGSKGKKLTRTRVSIYIVGVISFFVFLVIGLLFSLPFYFIFTP